MLSCNTYRADPIRIEAAGVTLNDDLGITADQAGEATRYRTRGAFNGPAVRTSGFAV